MASIIKLKRSTTPGGVPANSALTEGELAINIVDKKLFSSNGTATFAISGDQYNLEQSGNSSTATVSLTVDNDSLSNDSIFFAGGGTNIVSGNSSQVTITGTTYAVGTGGNTTQGTVTLTGTGGGDAGIGSAVSTIVGTSGTIVSGNSTQITIDSSTYELSTAGNTTIGQVTLTPSNGGDVSTETIDFVGGTDILISGNSTQITANNTSTLETVTGRGATTTSAVTINNTLAAGNTTITGKVTATTAEFGNTVITGSLSTSGGLEQNGALNITDTTQSTNTSTGSIITSGGVGIALNTNIGGNLQVDGLTTLTGNTTISDAVTVTSGATIGGVVDINDSTAASNTTTGALQVTGGAGIGGALYTGGDLDVGGNAIIAGNLTVQGTTTTVQSTTVSVSDNMLALAYDQTGEDTDAVDIGFYGTYDEGGTDKYRGIFFDVSSNVFAAVDGITAAPAGEVTYTSSDLAQIDAIIDGGTF